MFLAAYPNLVAEDLATVVRVDQSRRWEQGDRYTAEHYLARFPAIRNDPTSALDLIHHEFILRERLGPAPTVDEFTSRFPEHAATIRDQVAIHRALASNVCGPESQRPDGLTAGPRGIRDSMSPPEPMTRMGRYVLLERIGHGGMGTVYRAHDDQLDRQVALKVLRVGPDPDGQFASRFLREARIAAKFTDPRLCPVHDAGVLDGVHYFTMPLIGGETLASRIERGGAADPQAAARLVAVIARGMAIAHRAGVVHRDLKPANILMTEDGSPVVVDFGLARRQAAFDAVTTEKGIVLGTPGYMAPEQIGGDSRNVGPAADIYSLGVILYQLLTGRLPFDGPPHELMRKALTQNPVSPRQIRPDLEPRIERVCLSAMGRNIVDRYASMIAFADALDSCRDGTTSATHRPRPQRRRVTLTALIALGALLGLVSISLFVARTRLPAATSLSQPETHFPVGAIWSGRFRLSRTAQRLRRRCSPQGDRETRQRVQSDLRHRGRQI